MNSHEGVGATHGGTAPSIFLRGISKAFGETIALSDVSLDLRAGEVHALLGENGAGKTTLMKILYGLTQPDTGLIEADGVQLTINSPRDARAAGIGMVTQHFSLVKNMTVVENIALASASTFSLDLGVVRKEIKAASERFGLEVAEIEQVADRVSVLRRGKVVSSSSVSGISTQELIGLMMGTDEVAVAQRRTSKQLVGNPILALNGVGVNIEMGGLSEVSLDVHPGEIVGIAGVSGNGQAELVRVLSGTLAIDKGSIVVEGNTLGKNSPQSLMRAGVGMLGEDRHASAVHALQVMENLVLDCIDSFATRFQLKQKEILQHCESAIAQFEIKTTPKQALGTLSGGNMQKVLLARLFSRKPKVAIISQPTRGLDVMATRYVRSLIMKASTEGTAVLLVSEDLDEVLELADRVAVMYRGAVIGIVDGSTATRETIGQLMAGITK